MAVLISVPLAITAIYKFVVTPHVTRALTECHWAGHAEVAHLTATDPSFYRTQTQLIKACMDERGYAKAPVPMTGEALSLYRMLIHLGYAELDSAAVFNLYERKSR